MNIEEIVKSKIKNAFESMREAISNDCAFETKVFLERIKGRKLDYLKIFASKNSSGRYTGWMVLHIDNHLKLINIVAFVLRNDLNFGEKNCAIEGLAKKLKKYILSNEDFSFVLIAIPIVAKGITLILNDVFLTSHVLPEYFHNESDTEDGHLFWRPKKLL